jgi:hypothetical protein
MHKKMIGATKKKEEPNTLKFKQMMSKATSKTPEAKNKISQVVVKYDVGFKNALYIRGRGANLSWDKGIVMKNIGKDLWAWETTTPITDCEFKVLINDVTYEAGENHRLSQGKKLEYTPKF